MKQSIFSITILLLIGLSSCELREETEEMSSKSVKIVSVDTDTLKICEDERYNIAYHELTQMLYRDSASDFKRAVFLVEWAYTDGLLDYEQFNEEIARISKGLQSFIVKKGVKQYKTAGNYALFEFFTKAHPMNKNQPYTYDMNDFYGKENYYNVSVSKLLDTHTGQCRSMPMLYKILSEEIGAKSYLALAPNHMYIKHLDEQNKWVNIELTNGHFSSDSWMISSMDISAESIRKGVYMKELSQKENIAFCLLELGIAYEHEYGYDSVALKITDKVLEYFPTCIQAVMHKANAYKYFGKSYLKKHGRKKPPFLEANFAAFKRWDSKLDSLGYREMSKDNYTAWLNSMEEERQKQLAKSKK